MKTCKLYIKNNVNVVRCQSYSFTLPSVTSNCLSRFFGQDMTTFQTLPLELNTAICLITHSNTMWFVKQ